MGKSYISYENMIEIARKIRAQRGTANGFAPLDESGLVPTRNLPQYVSDVFEYATKGYFPAEGEKNKIYIAADTNEIYRWNNSGYTIISDTLKIGETMDTAFAGHRGKEVEDNIVKEEQNRIFADDDLSRRLSDETSNRANSDFEINQKIGDIEDLFNYVSDEEDDDEEYDEEYDEEEDDRFTLVRAINENAASIAAETSARTIADTALGKRIDTETNERKSADITKNAMSFSGSTLTSTLTRSAGNLTATATIPTGNASTLGIVKLIDTVADTNDATKGIAATPKAILSAVNNASSMTVANIQIMTGTARAFINTEKFVAWLVSKGYLTTTSKYRMIKGTWSYANNDVLQVSINGKNYEIQLAGAFIEIFGSGTDYQTGEFDIRITTAPTLSFTSTSGYEKFPAKTTATYVCRGNGYSPAWVWTSGGDLNIPLGASICAGGSKPFQTYTGDTNGSGIRIGAGGFTIIGGGESAETWRAGAAVAGQSERMVVANDEGIDFVSNLQNGYANRKTMTLATDGTLTVPTKVSAPYIVQTAGTLLNASNPISTTNPAKNPANVITVHDAYSASGPATYGNVINVGGQYGGTQIFQEWSGNQTSAGQDLDQHLWIRSRRDNQSAFTAWRKVANVSDIPGTQPTTLSASASGTTFTVNINGKTASATIPDAGVATAKLADKAVTTAKLADANVTTAKLATLDTITIKPGTNGIMVAGTGATLAGLKFIDGDSTGHGIQLGAGGSTVIGSGEAAANFQTGSGLKAFTEQLALASDNDIKFATNMQSGYSSAKISTLDTSGNLTVPGQLKGATVASTGATTVGGALTAASATINGTIVVSGAATLKSTLSVTGATTLAGTTIGGTLSLSGTNKIRIANASSGMWIKGRDNAAIRQTANSALWSPFASIKTKDGSVEIGCSSADNNLYFRYASDTNYNANTNTTVNLLQINNEGTVTTNKGTVAFTSQIPGAFTTTANGLVPASGSNTTKFLRGDGTWQEAGLASTVATLLGSMMIGAASKSNLPTSSAGIIKTGTLGYAISENQLYTATVSGTTVTWAASGNKHMADGTDYFHGTASTSAVNITSVGK